MNKLKIYKNNIIAFIILIIINIVIYGVLLSIFYSNLLVPIYIPILIMILGIIGSLFLTFSYNVALLINKINSLLFRANKVEDEPSDLAIYLIKIIGIITVLITIIYPIFELLNSI